MIDIPVRKTFYDLMERYQYIGRVQYIDRDGFSVERHISFDSDRLLSDEEISSRFSDILEESKRKYEIEDVEEIELIDIVERLEDEDFEDLEVLRDYFFRFNFFGHSRREVHEAYVEAIEKGRKGEFIAPFEELTEGELGELDRYAKELDKSKVQGMEKYQALSDLTKAIIKTRTK